MASEELGLEELSPAGVGVGLGGAVGGRAPLEPPSLLSRRQVRLFIYLFVFVQKAGHWGAELDSERVGC